jgi:methionine aminopeptidase
MKNMFQEIVGGLDTSEDGVKLKLSHVMNIEPYNQNNSWTKNRNAKMLLDSSLKVY